MQCCEAILIRTVWADTDFQEPLDLIQVISRCCFQQHDARLERDSSRQMTVCYPSCKDARYFKFCLFWKPFLVMCYLDGSPADGRGPCQIPARVASTVSAALRVVFWPISTVPGKECNAHLWNHSSTKNALGFRTREKDLWCSPQKMKQLLKRQQSWQEAFGHKHQREN